MPKYTVYGTVNISVTMEVEASGDDEAIQKAHEEFEGLSNYAGNGGTDKIVGTYQQNVSLDADQCEAVFIDAEPERN